MSDMNYELKECPLCGTRLKIPSFKCADCNKFIMKNKAVISKDQNARCNECNSVLIDANIDEIRKNYKCRECGLSIHEMENLSMKKKHSAKM